MYMMRMVYVREIFEERKETSMKTRDDLCGEAALLIRILTNYHAVTYEQALLLFPKKPDAMKSLIKNLRKQQRVFFDEGRGLLCDRPESADSPDYGMIAALWVLLDFKKAVAYHTGGDFPVKIHFFAQDEAYEIIHVLPGQEALMNHVLSFTPKESVNRLVVLEEESQGSLIKIPNVVAFCLVGQDGKVSYYRKGRNHG